jgi:hypothetical protein
MIRPTSPSGANDPKRPWFAQAALAAVLALAAAFPARGAVAIAASSFSLSFPDGWKLAPPGPTELPVVALDSALDVSCLFTLVTFSKPMAFADLKAPAGSFSHGDSVTKVEEGNLTLGGRTFLYAEYHGPDSGGVTSRVRAYYDLYDSTHLFCAFVDYMAPEGIPDVEVMETALADVRYSGVPTALRGIPGHGAQGRMVPDRKDRDLLGRGVPGGPLPRGARNLWLAPPR